MPTNRIGFGTDFVLSNSNVGIGTSSPTKKLHVAGDTLVTGSSTFVGDATFNSNVSIAGTLTYEDVTNVDSIGIITARNGITIDSGGLSVIGVSTFDTSIFSGNTSTDLVRITQSGSGNALVVEDDTNPDTTPFVVTGDGSVGIGTTNPTGKLNVNGNALVSGRIGVGTTSATNIIHAYATTNYTDIRLSNDANDAYFGISNTPLDPALPQGHAFIYNANDGISLYAQQGYINLSTGSNQQRVRVTNAGDVGIGTTNPTSKLQVAGDTNISGVVTAFDYYANAEYPSVRPSLDLAFAQTKTLDSRITFTRASTATFTDANGVIQTATTNTPRFDHDPATGESLGLLIEESRTNSYTYSQYLNQSQYTVTGATIVPNTELAPDGTYSAFKLVASTTSTADHFLKSTTAAGSNVQTTWTIYVKSAGYTRIGIGRDATDGFNLGIISLTTGQQLAASSAYPTVTATSVGNGWWRISFSIQTTIAAALTPRIIPIPDSLPLGSDANTAWAGDGVNGVYLWGFQMEAGSFPTSYIPTPATFTGRTSTATYYDANGIIQTAGIDVARSDAYFPDENGIFRPAGLLLEAAATNLLLNSDSPTSQKATLADSSTYSLSFYGTGTVNVETASTTVTGSELTTNGEFTTDLSGWVVEASANASVSGGVVNIELLATYRGIKQTISTTPGKFYQVTVRSRVVSGGGYADFYYNTSDILEIVSNSAIGFVVKTGYFLATSSSTEIKLQGRNSGQIIEFDYVRVKEVASTTAHTITGTGSYPTRTNLQLTTGTSIVDDRDYWVNISGSVEKIQLETGSYPTSYIPAAGSQVTRSADTSTSATVTRSADVASITGTNFSSWYRQDEGTLLVNAVDNVVFPSTLRHYADLNNNSLTSSIAIVQSNSPYTAPGQTIVAGIYDNSLQAAIDLGTQTVGLMRVAMAYKVNDISASRNGVLGTADTSASLPTPSVLTIGQTQGGSRVINSTISRLTYWPARLSNNVLQTITL